MCETLKVKLARCYQPGLTALLAADSGVHCSMQRTVYVLRRRCLN